MKHWPAEVFLEAHVALPPSVLRRVLVDSDGVHWTQSMCEVCIQWTRAWWQVAASVWARDDMRHHVMAPRIHDCLLLTRKLRQPRELKPDAQEITSVPTCPLRKQMVHTRAPRLRGAKHERGCACGRGYGRERAWCGVPARDTLIARVQRGTAPQQSQCAIWAHY